MLRATHLSITMPSHASFSILSGYHFSHHAPELNYYTRYRFAGSTEKVISLSGKKNTGKKTPKEDSELGYSDFTLALTLHLPHPKQKDMKLSPMHKKIEILEW